MQPTDIVQAQLDAYNAKDLDALLATYAPDAEQFTLHGERLARGHEEMRARFAQRFAEPDLHAKLLSRSAAGNVVVDHELITRNFPGEGRGTLEMMCVYELQDGLIRKASFAAGAKRLESDSSAPMQVHHRGRLIDHVHLRVADLDASKRFYRAVLQSIGREDAILEGKDFFAADELWIDRVDAAKAAVSRVHLAFQAPDRETVQSFHRAALAAGGKDHGAPGERDYHPGYYAAFVLDPDGHNIEAVFHGPAVRSAASVTITASSSA